MASRGTPKPLTLVAMREAIGVDQTWQVIWVGHDSVAEREHLCTSRLGPEGTGRSEWVRIRYAPTGTPGMQTAKCSRCRTAWARAARGGPESSSAA